MRTLIYWIAAVLVCAAIGFPPAEARMPVASLKAHAGSSVTPVHCRRTYHCRWDSTARVKNCHVCG